jgi:hypothetical protein
MSGREGARVLEPKWLVDIFVDAGLDEAEALEAAEAARRFLLARARRGSLPKAGDIKSWFAKDPMASFERLTGISGGGLPFLNDDTGRLDEVALTLVLREADLDHDVALAYARVVVEAVEPKEFFGPVWLELAQTGTVDLGALKRLDWSPLNVPDEAEQTKTTVAVRVEPRSGPSIRQARPLKKDPGRGGSGAGRPG